MDNISPLYMIAQAGFMLLTVVFLALLISEFRKAMRLTAWDDRKKKTVSAPADPLALVVGCICQRLVRFRNDVGLFNFSAEHDAGHTDPHDCGNHIHFIQKLWRSADARSAGESHSTAKFSVFC